MSDLRESLTQSGTLYGFINTIVYAHDYTDLTNKPQINGVTLTGNKTASELGLVTPATEAVQSVNGETGAVVLDGNDIAYDSSKTINQQIDAVADSIPVMAVTSVNGETGDVVLDGSDIRYDADYTVSAKIAAVEGDIPVVPVQSVNGETGAVVLDDSDIEHSSGVSVNSLINTILDYTPVYGNTASGSIATFDTSLALPLQDCTIEINGTNLTGANIYDKGINLCEEVWENGTLNTNTGVMTPDANSLCSKNYNPIKEGIVISLPIGSSTLNKIIFFDGAYNVIDNWGFNANSRRLVTVNAGTKYFKLTLKDYGGTYNNDISINYPATVEAYHAYNANSTTTAITWQSEAGTVSEGSLNVTTGKLTVVNGSMGAGDYQIVPIPINQLSGTNNIFCDTGNTSVVYACSLKDYIDSQ